MERTMMHGNITGIDISTEHITAVQTAGGLKGRRIRACTRVPLMNGDLEEALKTLAESMELKNDVCLVTIPENYVSFRNVAMPFTDAKKIRQALPFEVESLLPYPVEELLLDFVMTDSRLGGGVLAASVRKDDIADYLGALQSNGINPDVLEVRGSSLALWLLSQPGTPDHMVLVEVCEKRHTLVLCLNRRIALIRSFVATPAPLVVSDTTDGKAENRMDPSGEDVDPFLKAVCTEVHHTVHAFISGTGTAERPEKLFFTGERVQAPLSADLLGRHLDIPAEPIDVSQDKRVRMEQGVARDWSPALMNNALSLALRNGGRGKGFNLRRDDFSPGRQYQQIRKAVPKVAVFLILIFSFLAADMIIDLYSLKREYRALDREITTVFRQTLPQVTRIVDPVQQLRVSVEEMKRLAVSRPTGSPENTTLELLQEISSRIPPSVRLQVHRMVVDPETVRISGRTDAFNEVDRIKNDLARAQLFGAVNITSANLDRTGSKVQFEITIERKR